MTLHIAEISSKYKNAQAWVSIVSYFEKIEKIKIIKGKKILNAKYHNQFSPFQPKLG